MPTHFAVSEFILTIACLGAMWTLWNRSIRVSAIAMGILGLAAGLGTIRFAFGLGSDFAGIHRFVAQHGGVLATGLIALSFARGLVSPERRLHFASGMGLAVTISVLAGVINNAFQPLAALTWAVIIAALAPWQFKSGRARLLAFVFAAILPLNALFVRRSPALSVELSWHLYHVLVAIWVVAIAIMLLSGRERERFP
ncbi:MAG: hypothetical protein ACE37M_03035 [Henriciella sp.]